MGEIFKGKLKDISLQEATLGERLRMEEQHGGDIRRTSLSFLAFHDSSAQNQGCGSTPDFR